MSRKSDKPDGPIRLSGGGISPHAVRPYLRGCHAVADTGAGQRYAHNKKGTKGFHRVAALHVVNSRPGLGVRLASLATRLMTFAGAKSMPQRIVQEFPTGDALFWASLTLHSHSFW